MRFNTSKSPSASHGQGHELSSTMKPGLALGGTTAAGALGGKLRQGDVSPTFHTIPSLRLSLHGVGLQAKPCYEARPSLWAE